MNLSLQAPPQMRQGAIDALFCAFLGNPQLIGHLLECQAFIEMHEDGLPLAGPKAHQRVIQRRRQMRIGRGHSIPGRADPLHHDVARHVLAATISSVVAPGLRQHITTSLKQPPGQVRRRWHGWNLPRQQKENRLRGILRQM